MWFPSETLSSVPQRWASAEAWTAVWLRSDLVSMHCCLGAAAQIRVTFRHWELKVPKYHLVPEHRVRTWYLGIGTVLEYWAPCLIWYQVCPLPMQWRILSKSPRARRRKKRRQGKPQKQNNNNNNKGLDLSLLLILLLTWLAYQYSVKIVISG